MGPFKNLALGIMRAHIEPPKPMTSSILRSYLEFAADDYMIEDEPVMYRGNPITNIYICALANSVELNTIDGGAARFITASDLSAHLELTDDNFVVAFGGWPVVNARVKSGRVVLETFVEYLKEEAHV